MNKREVGIKCEHIAVTYLESLGYEIVDMNVYSRYGEIDIVAKDRGVLVFVEVRYRKNDLYGYPSETIDAIKQHKIIKTAKYYMLKKDIHEECPCRFDVVAICGREITYIKDAFWLN